MPDISSDHQERFGALSRLLGSAGLERLKEARVCVVGLGGVGSWAVEALARTGVGSITLVDLDDVCVTNVNRQLHALDGQIGRPKAQVLAERVRLISPECEVVAVTEFFTEKTEELILGAGFDGLIDAIDTMASKALLIAACVRRGIPCVTVGGAGGKRDAAQLRSGDLGDSCSDVMLRILRRVLRRDHGFKKGEKVKFGVRCVYSAESPVYPWSDGICRSEPEPGSELRLDCETGFGTGVFVTGAFGLAAAGELVRILTDAPVTHSRTGA
jgi:tRNA A37 threonylcarbamoyladenosine dehydratase